MKRNLLCSCLWLIATFGFSQTYLVEVKPEGGQLWGFVNLQGETIITPQFHMNKVCFQFSENGIAAVYEKENNKYYFINTRGEKMPTQISNFNLIGFEGYATEGFHCGRIAVNYNNRWGYLNDSGKVVIKAKYRKATGFNDCHALVKRDSSFFIIDVNANEIPLEAKDVVLVRHFSENLAPYRSISKKFGFIGIDGRTAIPAKYDGVGYFVNGRAWAKSGDKYGYLNTRGEWAIEPQFQECRDFDQESGMALVKLMGHWRYARMSGEVVELGGADEPGEFSEGLAVGKKKGLMGYYDTNGAWVIEPQFEDARGFKNGYAEVSTANKWGLVDKKGQWKLKATYKGIKRVELIP